MKIKWKLFFILFLVSVLCMHCSAQDSSYQPIVAQTIYLQSDKINVFPNPVPSNSDFNIGISSSNDLHLARIIVSDLSSNIIKDETVEIKKGDNKFTINMPGFNEGIFLVRVISKSDKPYFYSSQVMVQ